MKNKKIATIFTAITTLLCSVCLAIFGLIYNRNVLVEYGSEVAGLISTLVQFVSIFVILEGGYTTAALVSTYPAVVRQDFTLLNDILCSIKKYLNKIGIIIFIVSTVLGIFYLFFIDSPLEWYQTVALLFITITSTSFSILFQSRYSIVFNAYNKQYISSLLSLLSKTIVWALALILIVNKQGIVLVYCIYSLNIVLDILFFRLFIKKRFPEVTFKGKEDKKLITGTKDVFLQKIASTIFTSTDLVLISAGVGLGAASVYNIYHQVFSTVNSAESALVRSPTNSFGQLFVENKSRFKKIFSWYLFGLITLTTIFSMTVGLSVVDFVRIYTRGISDINYIVPVISLLFFSQFFLTLVNYPFGLLLNVSKNFKYQNFQCILGEKLYNPKKHFFLLCIIYL